MSAGLSTGRERNYKIKMSVQTDISGRDRRTHPADQVTSLTDYFLNIFIGTVNVISNAINHLH